MNGWDWQDIVVTVGIAVTIVACFYIRYVLHIYI